MRKFFIFASGIIFLSCTTISYIDSGQPEEVKEDIIVAESRVFGEKEGGYPKFRIPVVVKSKDVVIAVCEGRRSSHDHARNDIVLKRSTDNGRSWGELIVVDSNPDLVMVNPSPVVLDSGRIILFYETFPHGYHARAEGWIKMLESGFSKGTTQKLICRYSDDQGQSWSQPKYLEQITRADGNTTSGSPANGIVLQRGAHKGRIVMPAYFNRRVSAFKRIFETGCIYSDDNGSTWSKSEFVKYDKRYQTDEVLISEADDGSLYMNGRPGFGARTVSRSFDGGVSWEPFLADPVLEGSPCNSGLLKFRFGSETVSGLTLFSRNNSNSRNHGTLFLSYDDGRNWKYKKHLVKDYFGYSQIVKLSDTEAGIIYEDFDQKYLTKFMIIDLKDF